jgi:hypothetical protein
MATFQEIPDDLFFSGGVLSEARRAQENEL